MKIYEKEKTEKRYIYIEDEYFRKIVNEEKRKIEEEGKEAEIIEGKIEEAIEKINQFQAIGSSIYTKNRKKGYKFINEVNSENVYVNATLEKIQRPEEEKDIYYMNKNRIYEK